MVRTLIRNESYYKKCKYYEIYKSIMIAVQTRLKCEVIK